MTSKNHSRVCLIGSAAIIALAILMTLFGAGFRMGGDFAGGALLRLNLNQPFATADVDAALQSQGTAGYDLVPVGAAGTEVEIRLPGLKSAEEAQALLDGLKPALLTTYPQLDAEAATALIVGPVADAGLLGKALLAPVLFALLALAYVGIRLSLYGGMAAAAGVLHDTLIAMSFTVILRGLIPVNASFGVLPVVVAGYSLLQTVAMLGRVRENHKKPACSKLSREEVASLSVTESLPRVLFTTLSALILTGLLCCLSAASVRAFFLPVVVGILASAYSTVLIDGYLWACLQERFGKKKRAKGKAKKA